MFPTLRLRGAHGPGDLGADVAVARSTEPTSFPALDPVADPGLTVVPEVRLLLHENPIRVVPVGDLDTAALPYLERALALINTALTPADTRDLVVDLRETTFFGATGLSFLARLQVDRRGARIRVVNAAPVAHRVIVLGGMAALLASGVPPPRPPGEADR